MPSIGSVFLFAAGTAAQLTTSIWLPGGPEYFDSRGYIDSFNASVVAKDGDKTVMALNAVAGTATRGAARLPTQTMTVHGTTSFEYMSTYNSRVGYERTYSLGCSKAESSKVICTTASMGENMYSSYCSYYTRSATRSPVTTTRRITFDNPPQTVTQVYTSTYSDSYDRVRVPSICLSGSTLPESYYRSSFTVRPETYQIIVTAAAEKLTASGTPTPTSSGASNSNGTVTSSGAKETGSPAPSGSGGSAPPARNAAPMVTLAPAMAGLGAAAAAFFL